MRLNGKIINPGDLRSSITLQSRAVTKDAGGFQNITWADIATVKARWTNVHGSEVWSTGAIGANQAATVLIRYRAGIDTTCAVLKGSDRYEIISVDDIQDRHEYIEIKMKRVSAG